MKKIFTTAVVASALVAGTMAPAQASKDGELGYHIGCAIGKMLGIQMCGELEPGFGVGGGNTGGGGGR